MKKDNSRLLAKVLVRLLLDLHYFSTMVLKKIVRKKKLPGGTPRTLLLTGTFFSENWIMNHLVPLSLSDCCGMLRIVTVFPIPPSPKVVVIYPPRILRKVLSDVPARLVTFLCIGLFTRPDIVGGFHLLLNGLVAAFLAGLTGARSIYFCGGGPREVLDGGIYGSTLFGKLKTPDHIIERKLIRSINLFDAVITMGHNAVRFFREHKVNAPFEVIPGGIDSSRYVKRENRKKYDLIFVGRFDGVKRIDLFLETVRLLKAALLSVKAVLVGYGELEQEMKTLAEKIDVEENVIFAGYQKNIIEWLNDSRIFVLTSDSEGLSLALMEALMCGLPCVVSDVGELGELVKNGVNGYLVGERTPGEFSGRISALLSDKKLEALFSKAARESAMRFDIHETKKKWDSLLPKL
ncbi:MAG: glycosyltransferase family 4 protein [Chitinispirillaceae bacterium]|nr:glycosyltransferase family 4 protein [Chitinispirillaceae bacterium]